MDLSQVRENIDRVDKEIRRLFMERMLLSDQVACIKAETEDEIYKPDREESIIRKQTQGVDPKMLREYTALIKRIMEVSRKYQYGRVLEVRDCFPYSWSEVSKDLSRFSVLRDEMEICEAPSDSLPVDSFEEMGNDIKSGVVDAGMGVIEEVGVGVSDGLNNLLLDKELYITRYEVREKEDIRYKIVTFTDQLEVLPEHNRMKIMFACPNRSGSLGSVLSMISDYGVNLTEIHSRPYKEEDTWNYRFFAELNANMNDREIRALLFQLSSETMKLKLLGSYYCEGDF
ncbi:MAG: chorismate mutase [Clostridiales bacterium]|nr:chorismate mutase [Clostridiales bacterium]